MAQRSITNKQFQSGIIVASQSNLKTTQIVRVEAFSEFAKRHGKKFPDKDHEVSVDEAVVDQLVDFIDSKTDNKLNFTKAD